MVKSYNRFELAQTFGIVSSACDPIFLNWKNRIAVAADEAVLVWDVKTSELVSRLVDPQQPPSIQVCRICYEPINELLAAGYTDGSIRVWDLRTSTVLIVFNGHRSFITALCFSLDGVQLVSGGADTSIVVWDLVNEVGVYRLRGMKALITSLVWIGNNHLISTGKDGIMKLWDLETQFCTETKVCHKGECWSATSMDDNKFATVGNGVEVRVWEYNPELREGSQLNLLGELIKDSKHRGISLVYNRDTLFVASGDSVQSWKLKTAEELKRTLKRKQKRSKQDNTSTTGAPAELGISDMFTQLFLVRTRAKISGLSVSRTNFLINLNSNSVEQWSISSPATSEPQLLYTLEGAGHRTDIRDCAISADGSMIASGSNGMIKVHNAYTGHVVRTLNDTGYILCLQFLNSETLVFGNKEGQIELYDITKAVKICEIDAHKGSVWSLDVASDGKFLVSGGADKTVRFWSLKTVEVPIPGRPDLEGVSQLTLKNTHKLEFNDDVLAVKLSPDCKLVAASLLDSTVKVYKVETLKFFLNLYGHQLPVLSIDISHDNKLLVSSSADKNVKLWGLDFGDCHKSIFAHDDSVLRVVFEPESYNFLSSSKDGMVKYWDGAKFVQIQGLRGHHSEVWALAVAKDGSYAVSASHDKTIRLWELTDEPLFIEEERDAELEEQFEEQFVQSLDKDELQATNKATTGGDGDGEAADADDGRVEDVKKFSSESLKAGEKLYETLDICLNDLRRDPTEQRHVILAALDLPPERYLMDVLSKIKTPLVEDALLTFPLDRVVGLLTFIEIWLEKQWNLQLVCRVLFFCLKSFHKQIVASKMLQPELEQIRDNVRKMLLNVYDQIGFNLEYMNMLQSQWNESHVHEMDGIDDQRGEKRLHV